jgi:hypothetical protein
MWCSFRLHDVPAADPYRSGLRGVAGSGDLGLEVSPAGEGRVAIGVGPVSSGAHSGGSCSGQIATVRVTQNRTPRVNRKRQAEVKVSSSAQRPYAAPMEVPVQFFQSIIAIEVAIAGALLFQVRYFDSRLTAVDTAGLPDPRWRLVVAVILGATIFGSLDGIAHGGGRQMAAFVTLGVALSVLPILIRVLPPLVRDAHPGSKRSYSVVTIIGMALYVLAVTALIILVGR